jgi:hypothetical protein
MIKNKYEPRSSSRNCWRLAVSEIHAGCFSLPSIGLWVEGKERALQ